ncbi:unnamed protein product [Amoebophrya sp. A25]|nr:unnamed protein product [Amoebophrya sp. A25]|eukprot:GSA25T00003130001.1
MSKKQEIPEEKEDESSSDDCGPMPVAEEPKKKKRKILQHADVYRGNLPNGLMYERSFMHREPLKHICVSPETDFVVTGSEKDGVVKFWKKQYEGIEFVKLYRAHALSLLHMSISKADGRNMCSIGVDCQFDSKGKPIASTRTCALKYFDVVNFDLSQMTKLNFVPLSCEFVNRKEAASLKVAVSDANSGEIRIFTNASEQPIAVYSQRHQHPVTMLRYHPALDCVLSHDKKGFLEIWDPATGKWPEQQGGSSSSSGGKNKVKAGTAFSAKKPPLENRSLLQFRSKTDGTDLYELNKAQSYALDLQWSADGEYFAMLCADDRVRVFRTRTGKKMIEIDEGVDVVTIAQNDPGQQILHLDHFDFGKRVAVERELKKAPSFGWQSISFDESSNFLFYPTLAGIKVFNLVTKKLDNLLGKVESSERFLQCVLFQGRSLKQGVAAGESVAGKARAENRDPTLFATSFRRNRFYLFTRRDPDETLGADDVGRDVFNEKPTKEDQALALAAADTVRLGKEAIIHTTLGDIVISLFYNECPKTVENFCTHARNKYYDGIMFHRIIKGFMIQTGDPLGNGTGGESIWGGNFEDEIRPQLRHDRPFTVSMANAGPNTNGSQFFITTVNCPHLDRKHTVFGRVVRGEDVVTRIERIPTRSDDRPIQEIKMVSIQIT